MLQSADDSWASLPARVRASASSLDEDGLPCNASLAFGVTAAVLSVGVASLLDGTTSFPYGLVHEWANLVIWSAKRHLYLVAASSSQNIPSNVRIAPGEGVLEHALGVDAFLRDSC